MKRQNWFWSKHSIHFYIHATADTIDERSIQTCTIWAILFWPIHLPAGITSCTTSTFSESFVVLARPSCSSSSLDALLLNFATLYVTSDLWSAMFTIFWHSTLILFTVTPVEKPYLISALFSCLLNSIFWVAIAHQSAIRARDYLMPDSPNLTATHLVINVWMLSNIYLCFHTFSVRLETYQISLVYNFACCESFHGKRKRRWDRVVKLQKKI